MTQDLFYSKLHLFPPIEDGFYFEKLNKCHTPDIVSWRNEPSNLELFENKNELTIEAQNSFIENYSALRRVDLVLKFKDLSIGVFSIKNLQTEPEYGALIGVNDFRGKGLGTLVKKAFIQYWFEILNQDVIYVKNDAKNSFLIDSNIKLGFEIIRIEKSLTVLELNNISYEKNYNTY